MAAVVLKRLFLSFGLLLVLGGQAYAQGTIQIENSTLSNNTATTDSGGAISNRASGFIGVTPIIIIVNSTISGNFAGVRGGGIANGNDVLPGRQMLLIANSTITNNDAASGGGVYSELFTDDPATPGFYFANTIISGNSGGTRPDISAFACSIGYNLIGDLAGFSQDTSQPECDDSNDVNEDPLLGTLADNGGDTETHDLDIDSPAVDAGSPEDVADSATVIATLQSMASVGGGTRGDTGRTTGQGGGGETTVPCIDSDQRTVMRPIDGNYDGVAICDIGAFELTPPPICGDGFVNLPGEECDDGTLNSDTEPGACRTTCLNPFCGDGVNDGQNFNEFCDDGNTESADGCSSTCTNEFCGDGILQQGLPVANTNFVEECDSGESTCNSQCQVIEEGDETNVECTTTTPFSGGGRADCLVNKDSLEQCVEVQAVAASGTWLLFFPFTILGIRRWYDAEKSNHSA